MKKAIEIKDPCVGCLVFSCCSDKCRDFISMVQILLKTHKRHPYAKVLKEFEKTRPIVTQVIKNVIRDFGTSIKIKDKVKEVHIHRNGKTHYFLK